MTNNEIMAEYKQEKGLASDYEMYTTQTWYKKGFIVKKGSVCKHRVKMCKNLGKVSRPYTKEFSLFTREQVEPR